MKFSEKIIQARKTKALTQEDLAEAVGVSRQAVSKWETEEAKPDLDKLVAICNVLDLSMDYLCLDKMPEVTVELPQPQKPKHGRYLIAGICLGLVAAILVGLLAMGIAGRTGEKATEPEPTIVHTTTTQPTAPDYSDRLHGMETSDAGLVKEGAHIWKVTFVPSVQVPGMQVRFAVRNNVTGQTQYVDAYQQGAGYWAHVTTPEIAYDVTIIAVCTVGEVSAQCSLYHQVSEDGSSARTYTLWKAE